MKNIFKFSALFCAMTFLVTSCSQDAMFEPEEPQYKPAVVGDEIIFGSRAGFENATPGTRTVYSGEKYKVGDVEFERIDWVNDDLVEIYCPQAAGEKAFTYKVTRRPVNEAEKDEDGNVINDYTDHFDEAYLSKIDENSNGLAWASDDKHYFYAMYPSVEQIKEKITDPNNTVVQGVKMDGSKLKGVVPVTQPGIGLDVSSAIKVLKPNMDYAYMAAHATATKEDGAVTLNFVPIVTALEIELKTNGVDTSITDVMVTGPGIAGSFTADLSYDAWGDKETYPTCENGTEYVSDVITISLPKTVELKAEAKESFVFTVFLRPGDDYSSLTVSYSPDYGASWVKKVLGDGDINTKEDNIIATKKNVVKNFKLLNLDAEITVDASHWMDQLPDDRMLGYLSLPGTGGSFSAGYNDVDPDYYKQQTLGLDAQWNLGIRAFEVIVDRMPSSSSSLATADVKCNKKPVGVSFNKVMTDISNKLIAQKGECAVVIITYQPEDNDPNRNAYAFAQNLVKWWESVSNKSQYALYSPTATLGNENDPNSMRGKILVLLRLNQFGENDNGGEIGPVMDYLDDKGCPFVVIDGCGTAKDRWGARGYHANNVRCLDISNDPGDNAPELIENYMTGNPGLVFNTGEGAAQSGIFTRPAFEVEYVVDSNGDKVMLSDGTTQFTKYSYDDATVGMFDFDFDTNHKFTCWYQDWYRVVKTPVYEKSWSFTCGTILGFLPLNETGTTSWFESLHEKKANIQLTFQKAIESDPNDSSTSNRIFVNSLSGYLLDESSMISYTPSIRNAWGGAGGNIQALADELNPWFAQLVFDAGMEQTTGPTGVILMDRVTSDNKEVIGRIVSNNFKFSVK